MRNTVKAALLVAGGIAIGSGATYLTLKAKYKAIADEEIATVTEHYRAKEADLIAANDDELENVKQMHGLINHEDPREALKIYTARLDELAYLKEQEEAKPETDETASAKIEREEVPHTPYNRNASADAAYERVGDIVVPPMDEDEDISDEDEEKLRGDMFEASIRSDLISDEEEPREGTFVISYEEFAEDSDEYERVSVSYFPDDNVLADEQNMPIPDIEANVGEANLARFGELSQDPSIVYVRNSKIKLDYEICKEEGSYVDSIMGAAPGEEHIPYRTWRVAE